MSVFLAPAPRDRRHLVKGMVHGTQRHTHIVIHVYVNRDLLGIFLYSLFLSLLYSQTIK
jgi:hypothetical protein